jgi:hypothetical protein
MYTTFSMESMLGKTKFSLVFAVFSSVFSGVHNVVNAGNLGGQERFEGNRDLKG